MLVAGSFAQHITGKLYDVITKEPITGAIIENENRKATIPTGNKGTFQMAGITGKIFVKIKRLDTKPKKLS